LAEVVTELEKARAWVIARFPALDQSAFEVTSQPTRDYNCIAWAVGDDKNFWWPTRHWPTKRTESRQSFLKAFATKGYRPCKNADPEPGFEKIALYMMDGKPTHAARLLDDGKWTSKLGTAYDITHTLDCLNGDRYGKPVLFLKRKCATDED
jgi:hypothetical protein